MGVAPRESVQNVDQNRSSIDQLVYNMPDQVHNQPIESKVALMHQWKRQFCGWQIVYGFISISLLCTPLLKVPLPPPEISAVLIITMQVLWCSDWLTLNSQPRWHGFNPCLRPLARSPFIQPTIPSWLVKWGATACKSKLSWSNTAL